MAPPVEVARYTSSGALHVIIAARDPDGRWMILDTSESGVTVVDVLRGHDDRFEQARAVAREYASQQEAHYSGGTDAIRLRRNSGWQMPRLASRHGSTRGR